MIRHALCIELTRGTIEANISTLLVVLRVWIILGYMLLLARYILWPFTYSIATLCVEK